MTKLEQAARQALGALEVATTPLAKDRQEVLRAITTLREALSGVQALSAAPSLEPCPFCGAHAIVHNDTDSPLWFAGCSGVDCEIEPHCYAESETAAAAAWNRRVFEDVIRKQRP